MLARAGAIMKQYVLGLGLAVCTTLCTAGIAHSQFFVKVELRRGEKCINEALSERTGALVQVVCRSGNFVSIEPQPGRSFVGSFGGAYRYFFNLGSGSVVQVAPNGEGGAVAELYAGYGTVTGVHVFDVASEPDADLQLLITY